MAAPYSNQSSKSILPALLFACGCFALSMSIFLPASAAAEEPARSGIFYGFVRYMDREQLVVTPIDKKLSPRRFYLDAQTGYLVKGKKKSWENVYLGDKVAVSYFALGRTAIADQVFVVFGEFKPDDYVAKPKAAGKGKKKGH